MAQNHYFVVIFQWIGKFVLVTIASIRLTFLKLKNTQRHSFNNPSLDEGVVRTDFYRLIELGVAEGGDDLVDAFMAKVLDDGIKDIIDRVIGVVSIDIFDTFSKKVNL